ncbi:MAG: hypothetical protein K8R68_05110 [Bacteroidales bacterium]|nr:hypothetical protein [Bacteroidales bacterium]
MRKIIITMVFLAIAFTGIAQIPQAFKYQALVRDSTGNILADQNVSFRISILQTSITGYAVYVETHGTTTSQFGLVNLEIGNGNVVSGVFENINWTTGLYFIKTEMDPDGGTNYQFLGASRLLSLPFALESQHSSSLTLTDENGRPYDISIDTTGNFVINPVWICGDTLEDNRDGQKYSTVQIGTHCWMAENINIGTIINGSNNQIDNGTIEKFCYSNNVDNCNVYGGLYQWPEMMQYNTTQATQGICPAGWHVPTDNEWKILEGFADSQYGIGNPIWDSLGFRGSDVGLNLKSVGGWDAGYSGADLYDFTARAGGARDETGWFFGEYQYAYFWSSNESGSEAWSRSLRFWSEQIIRWERAKDRGQSVRCLKN